MAFPGRIPVPAQNPYPNEPVYGNIWSDVGSGLRQTGGDVDEFAEQKSVKATRQAQIQDMIEKRKQALAVQAAKEEYERKQMILDEAKQAEIERAHKAAETLETRKWDEAKANREAKEKADIALAGQRDRSPVSRSGSGRGPTEKSYEKVDSEVTKLETKNRKIRQLLQKAQVSAMDPGRDPSYFGRLWDAAVAIFEGEPIHSNKEAEYHSTGVRNSEELIPKLEAIMADLEGDLKLYKKTQQDLIKKGVVGDSPSTPQAPTVSSKVQEALSRAQRILANPNSDPALIKKAQGILDEYGG